MKKISLISLTTLLFLSMAWLSCQKSKEVVTLKTSTTQLEQGEPMTSGNPTLDNIAHAYSNYLITLNGTPQVDFDLYVNTMEDEQLSITQRETIISANANANANSCLLALKNLKQQLDVVDLTTVVSVQADLEYVVDVVSDDIISMVSGGGGPSTPGSCVEVLNGALNTCLVLNIWCMENEYQIYKTYGPPNSGWPDAAIQLASRKCMNELATCQDIAWGHYTTCINSGGGHTNLNPLKDLSGRGI